MRPIVQILRFYTIAKFTGYRSMENILQMPTFNPLLKLCVDTVKRYPDWALEECDRISDSLDNHTFKFNSDLYYNAQRYYRCYRVALVVS